MERDDNFKKLGKNPSPKKERTIPSIYQILMT